MVRTTEPLRAWLAGPAFFNAKAPFRPSNRTSAFAVNAVAVKTGPIAQARTFSGTLDASEKFIVAPKVSGRVELLAVDIGDRVRQGQQVVRLDHDEFKQAVTLANESQARSNLDIAARELARIETLRNRGVSSDSQLDAAQAQRDLLASQISEVRAVINDRIALVDLFVAEGSLLPRRGISIGENK